MTKKIFSVLAILLLTSCYASGYGNYETQSDYSKSATYKQINNSYFWGLKKSESKSGAKEKCAENNGKVTKIESNNGVFTYIVRLYTLGIYWPQNQKIHCEVL